MEALSRLKATVEACIGLFRQLNMKTLSRDSWLVKGCHAEAAQPREAHRATSKDVRANVSDTPRQKQHRCAEHARLRCTSLSHRALTHAGNPVLIGRKQVFFREVTVAWTEAYRQDYVNDAIHWFLHKFKIYLADTLRAFKAAARLMCPATAPSLNQTAAGNPLSLWGHHHAWTARLCHYGAASWLQVALAEGHLTLSDRIMMADLAAKKIDWWRQNEDNLPYWAGAVKMVLNLSSLLLPLLGELSAYSEPPFQFSSRLHSR